MTGQRAEGRGQNARRVLVVAFCSLLSALCSISVRGEIIDRVLAILPGQIITQTDVRAALDLGLVEAPAGNDRIAAGLSALIDRVLMLNEVRRVMPPEPSQAAVDARLARIRQRFDSSAALARVLAASGVDETILRVYAADDLRLTSYLDERFSAASQPTDQELRQVGEAARAGLATERRQNLISAWVAELRRRADVTVVSSK
ncbi:MAG TPA: hypothetical protein VJM31_12855 [Vicinamibacterales bacterium]|nr:hypothetical protein [Vicinamibacterales bacterium]